jgi:hypothetical protein
MPFPIPYNSRLHEACAVALTRGLDRNIWKLQRAEEPREKIALMMEAIRISETSVNIHGTTWRNIQEGYHLYTRRCEN